MQINNDKVGKIVWPTTRARLASVAQLDPGGFFCEGVALYPVLITRAGRSWALYDPGVICQKRREKGPGYKHLAPGDGVEFQRFLFDLRGSRRPRRPSQKPNRIENTFPKLNPKTFEILYYLGSVISQFYSLGS